MMVQEDEQILGEIAGLLNDLKDQEAADLLAAAIANPEYKTIRHTLLAACWQNGLSYGKYLGVFAEVLISADYVTAIEAFTVLEEAIGDVDAPVREKLASRLKSRLNEMEEIKKPLLSELIKTINSY
jgi:hypothetical protein